jgi:hypothetical protein
MGRYDDDDLDIDLGRRGYVLDGRPHSSMGVVAILLAAVALIVGVAVLAVGAYVDEMPPMQEADEDLLVVLIGVGVGICLLLTLVGLILGLAGMSQRYRNPLFGILGSVFNGVVMVGMVFLLCLGLIAG